MVREDSFENSMGRNSLKRFKSRKSIYESQSPYKHNYDNAML